MDFFQNLYSVDMNVIEVCPIRGCFSKIPSSVIQMLEAKVSMEKVRSLMFSMAPLKAPRLHGFHAKFF